MRKIQHPLSEKLPAAIVYLDDVEKIVQTLGEVAKDIELRTDDYKLDNSSELKQLGVPSIQKLTISSRTPHISVEIKPREVWMYSSDPAPAIRGAFASIKDHLKSRTSFFQRELLNVILSLVLLYVAMSLFRNSDTDLMVNPSRGFLLLVSLVWLWWAGFGADKRHVIRLANKNNSLSFFERKKDEIILAAIAAIFGAVIGSIVHWYSRSSWGNDSYSCCDV